MFRKKKIVKIDPKIQLEIFEMVFLHMLDYPSMRWMLQRMITSRDRIDNASLDLQLRKLEFELIIQKGGNND